VVLRFGETLEDVGKAHGVSAKEIRKLNGVKDSLELRGGMAIVVPRRAVAVKDRPPKEKADKDPDAGDEAAGDQENEPDTSIIVAVPDRSFGYDGRERVFYRTRDGDGLDEIADVFGVRPEDLVEWNNLDPDAKLHPRMILQIFVRKDFDPAGVVLLDPTQVRVVTLGSEEFLQLETARRGKKRLFYTAKPGDTLAKLGRRYGLTPGDLARINRFSYNTELHEGDRVVVYSPTGDAPRAATMGATMGMTPKKRPERGNALGATAHRPAAESEHKAAAPVHASTSTAHDPKKKLQVAVAKPTSKPVPKASSKPAGKITASSTAGAGGKKK
jgi:membrane-bound lytic murein transglycosylase D